MAVDLVAEGTFLQELQREWPEPKRGKAGRSWIPDDGTFERSRQGRMGVPCSGGPKAASDQRESAQALHMSVADGALKQAGPFVQAVHAVEVLYRHAAGAAHQVILGDQDDDAAADRAYGEVEEVGVGRVLGGRQALQDADEGGLGVV